jgi:hypothetical protein
MILYFYQVLVHAVTNQPKGDPELSSQRAHSRGVAVDT